MKNISNLIVLNISHNMITNKAANDIADILSQNIYLKELHVANNLLETNGTIILCKGMSNISCLTHLDMSCNQITDDAAHDIATILFPNLELKELNLSNNFIQTPGSAIVFKGMSRLKNLSKLNIGSNNITEAAANDIVTVLSKNICLKELYLANNHLGANGIIILCKGMSNISCLTHLDMSCNIITDEAAHDIASLLFHNLKLKELDLSNNSIETPGAIKLCKGISVLTNLTRLNMSINNITGEATHNIVGALSQKKCLKELHLNCTLETSGALKITVSMNNDTSSIKVNVRSIKMTDLIAKNIANVLNNNIKLDQLDLCYTNSDATGISCIFKKLSIVHFPAININVNVINEEAAHDIGIFLSKNKNIKQFNISCNNLCASLTKNLSKIFNNLMILTKLKVGSNSFTHLVADDVAAVLLRNTKLEKTDLNDNNSLVVGAILILINSMKNMFTLRSINGSHGQITNEAADDIVAVLSHNTDLRKLCLADNNLEANVIITLCEGISNILHLTNLDMSSNKITDKAAHSIATLLLHNIKLKEIDLSNNLLQTPGAAVIFKGMRGHKNLIKLNISNNSVTGGVVNVMATILSQNVCLKELYLANNLLGTDGIITLCKGMSNVTSLTHLDMSYNIITDEAAHDIASLLFHNLKLKELDFSNNSIETPGAIILCKRIGALTNLTKLNVSINNITGEAAHDIATLLSQKKYLVELDFSYNLEVFGAVKFIVCMKNNTGFIKVTVDHRIELTDITASSIADVLNNNIKLEKLDLCYTNSNAKRINGIIRNLYLSHFTIINISINVIGEEEADDIGRFLSKNVKLKELTVSCNNHYESCTRKLCKRIKHLRNLTKLNIGGINLTHLAADDVAAVLLRNTKLEDIDLSDNDLLSIGAISIFNGMKEMYTLQYLDISDNWISSEAANFIAPVLSQNIYLKELYLANNYFEANGVITLCKEMCNITYLTHLDISCNKVTDEAARDIAILLFHNLNLSELDLSNNLIQAPGATKILSKCLHLSKINICKNAITDEAADTIAKLLSQSTKLKEFDVSYNYLQAVGAVKIFRAIKSTNLEKLNMSNNMITDEAADGIISVLSTITKSLEVNLENNKMSSVIVYYIKSSLSKIPK